MTNLISDAFIQAKELVMKAMGELVADGTFPAEPVPAFNTEIPADSKNGDVSTNAAMVCARPFRNNPRKIAEAIVSKIDLNGSYFARCEVAGPGFINFFYSTEWYATVVATVLEQKEKYGETDLGAGKSVLVEFVSANPTGPMHIGNARGGAIGDCLASVLEKAGYEVAREFYINDAGNQIEKFKTSLEVRYLQIYKPETELPEDAYQGQDIIDHANAFNEIYGDKYVNADSEERRQALCDFALPKNIQKLHDDLGKYRIQYDKWFNERMKVLNNMKDQGYISQEEYDEAVADNVYDRIQLVNIESETNSINSYFVDELTDQVIQDLVEQKGYTETQAYKALYQGGLTIYSTQDPEIQAICDDEVNNLDNYPTAPKVSFSYRLSVRSADGSISNYSEQTMLSYYQSSNKSFSINFNSEEEAAAAIEQYKTDIMKDGDTIVNGSETVTYTLQPQAALTIIDQSTGNVKALVGGRGDKTANKTLNRAADTTRQPGSTFKIIAAYAPALDAGGLTLASVQDDAPYNYGSGQGGAVNNYDNRYRGFTTLREAITNSINIVTVKTLAQIGPSLGYDYICDFGITTVGLDESSNETLALGGLTHGVTNLELTAAYATIANSGTYIKPKFYTKILDHDGNVLIDNTEPVSHTVLKDTTTWLLTDAMKDVMTQGTGTPAYFGSSMAQAGKSGTTTKNRDALFAGFTPYYTCVVWGGFDDNSPQSGGQTTYPKKIWKAVMSRIHENLEYQDFTKPSGIVTAQVCKESGKLAIAGVCDADPRGSQVYTEYFAEGTQPTEYCDHHIVANICNASGQLAGGYCPADSISSRVFVIGGTVGTEDTPYLLTDDFKNNTCTMHNEGNSTYQGTSAFSAVPGVNNDTSGGTQAPADNTQQTQPPANNSGGDNSDSTPADTGGTDNSGGGSSDNTPADTGGTDNSSGDNNSDGNGG